MGVDHREVSHNQSEGGLIREIFERSDPKMTRGNLLKCLARATMLQRQPNIPSQSMPFLHIRNCSGIDPPTTYPPPGPGTEPWIPEYVEKFEEPLEEKRARLVYQSRKRGMLENGLLLGSFASKHLATFDDEKPALNDWEIFYWAVGQKETPEDFDNVIMDMLKEHAKN